MYILLHGLKRDTLIKKEFFFNQSDISSSTILGFPCVSDVKESACNAGDLSLILGLGRSLGGGQGNPFQYSWGFPGISEGKVSACNVGDPGSISGSGRSPGDGNGDPLQSSCLENPMDRRA